MKARIPKQKETVLLYGLPDSDEKGIRVRGILRSLSIEARDIMPRELGEQVGYLIGAGGFAKTENAYAEEVPQEECMVFSGISSKRLDVLLSELRKADVHVDLKACVTGTNQKWSFAKLMEEILREQRHINSQKDAGV